MGPFNGTQVFRTLSASSGAVGSRFRWTESDGKKQHFFLKPWVLIERGPHLPTALAAKPRKNVSTVPIGYQHSWLLLFFSRFIFQTERRKKFFGE